MISESGSATRANDPHDLQRFVAAQDQILPGHERPIFQEACTELSEGQKRSHWMWFIFPQLKGLGSSATSDYFGISSRQESEAYLEHPVLGPRLRQCTHLVTLVEGRSINQIFKRPDNKKFRSSMTLFASATSENQLFNDALQKYFDGELDRLTLRRL